MFSDDLVLKEKGRNGTLLKRSGSTRGSPAARLNKQQDHIDGIENKAKADGVVSKKEQQRIDIVQDRASQNMYRKKHDPRARDTDRAEVREACARHRV